MRAQGCPATDSDLILSQSRHRNRNVERRRCTSHPVLASIRRESTPGTVPLAPGSPEHITQHASAHSRARRSKILHKTESGVLIRVAEVVAIGLAANKPQTSRQLGGGLRWHRRPVPIHMLLP